MFIDEDFDIDEMALTKMIKSLSRASKNIEDGFVLELFKRELFETICGIYDHKTDIMNPKLPFMSMILKPELDMTYTDPYEREVARLLRYNVPNRVNQSIEELFDLSVYRYDLVVEACIKLDKKETKKKSESADLFDNLGKEISSLNKFKPR